MQCNYNNNYFIIKSKRLRTLTCKTHVSSACLFSLLLEGGKKPLMVCLLGCMDMNTCWRGRPIGWGLRVRLVEYSKYGGCTDVNTILLEG